MGQNHDYRMGQKNFLKMKMKVLQTLGMCDSDDGCLIGGVAALTNVEVPEHE